MFRPAALFIGLRYTRAKKRSHFISFISMVSLVGIALGVMVLITVLSVMNGFDKEIQKRVFSMVPPISVSNDVNSVADWEELQKALGQMPDIKATAPYITGQVLLSYGSVVEPAIISGILPNEEKKITEVADKMVQGKLTDLHKSGFGIVLGESLAERLNANIGDKITIVTPQVTMSPAGVMPRFKRFTVVGMFRAGNGFAFDRGLGFIQLNDAQKLLGLGDNVSGLHVNLDNPYSAQKVRQQLMTQLAPSAYITTWADQFGELFHAIELEKTMMFFVLMLIVVVAAFNLVSTLFMVVNEKQSDIAILRTFGATPGMILQIFMVQGGLVGILGTLIGTILGILLAWNVTDLVNWLEHTFHVQFLSSNVYFVNYLPSQIEWMDVIIICVVSMILSLLATIYPAWRASKLDPVESLRYE